MAFDFNGVATLIKEQFGPAFIEVLRRETIFADLMEPRKESYVEKDAQWKINYAGNSSVGSYTESGNFGTAGEQAYTTAQLDWKLNKAVVQVTGLAQRVSESASSIINATAQEIESALKDLKRNMNLQLLSDGSGNLNGLNPALNVGGVGADITGIQAAIDDGSDVVTYAGINRTTNLWWRSYVLRNGGVPRPITESLMFQIVNEMETRGGKCTHILCSPSTWTAYGMLLKAERRQPQNYGLSGGWKGLDFAGIPVLRIPSYQENRMDFIDIEQIDYMILQDFSVETRDPGSVDAVRFFMKNYSQLKVENPWLMGSLRDLQAA